MWSLHTLASWFKLNNLGPRLGMNLKFYTSLGKGLKLKVSNFILFLSFFFFFLGGGGGGWGSLDPPILNRVKSYGGTLLNTLFCSSYHALSGIRVILDLDNLEILFCFIMSSA